jgi:Short-chain dehydrogenases of various substrate specificities
MKEQFENKVVLITGGSSGIGLAIAQLLLQLSAKVAVCARNMSRFEILSSIPNQQNLLIMQADVSVEEDCKQFVEKAATHFGRIDILINNAGISMRALFNELDLSVLRKNMDINFWGTVYCSKYAVPYILQTKGSIAGISSIAGYKGLPCRTGYSASKFAMQGFLESLRIELLYSDVNVLWISPGFVASNIRNQALNAQGHIQQETPLNEKKLMSAERCAYLILKAIANRKRSLLLSAQGKLTVWLNKFFPSLMDKIVFKHFLHEPDSPLKTLHA